jgi:hypothetical protein
MMHKIIIVKILEKSLTNYRREKTPFFKGKEGALREKKFLELLTAYKNDCSAELNPIYEFYLQQAESSLLRSYIKQALLDILDIPVRPIASAPLYYYGQYRDNHFSALDVALLRQERELNTVLHSMTHPSEIEMVKSLSSMR